MWWTLSEIKTRAKAVVIPCIAVVLGGLAVLLWMRFAKSTPTYDPTPQPVQTASEAKKAKDVARKIVRPGPPVLVTLDKKEIAEALKMPELATSPDNVLAAVTIKCPDRDVTAVSLLDPQGQGSILYRTEKQKFFQLKKEFGVRAGMGTGGLILGEVYARPLRIGPVDIELRGYMKRDDRSGGDGGGVILLDYKF